MQFTVSTLAQAKAKITAFTQLFDSEPTGISVAGIFELRDGGWVSAWEWMPHTHIPINKLGRVWMSATVDREPADIRPVEKTFELFIH